MTADLPRSLADPARLAERVAALDRPSMAPLNGFVADLRAAHGRVPDFDPFDGGADAPLLILLESPGPSIDRTRFVSRDNPNGTAANLRRFLAEAGIARADTLIWNAVPFVIHAPGARNRAPRRAEIAAGLALLPPLLDRLPRLEAVVMAGRVAARSRLVLREVRPDLALFEMPHPSPTYVCTSPLVPARIRAVLADARAMLDRSDRREPLRLGGQGR